MEGGCGEPVTEPEGGDLPSPVTALLQTESPETVHVHERGTHALRVHSQLWVIRRELLRDLIGCQILRKF